MEVEVKVVMLGLACRPTAPSVPLLLPSQTPPSDARRPLRHSS